MQTWGAILMRIVKLLIIIIIALLSSQSYAAVFVNESFDGAGWSDFCTAEYPPSPWCQDCGATGSEQTSTQDGQTHCELEVYSPGRGGTGNSMRHWRYGSLWQGDTAISLSQSALGGSSPTVIYMRWYMLVPVAWSSYGIDNQKLWRVRISGNNEMYLNFYGNEESGTTHLRYCPNGSGDDCFASDVASSASWHDGQWHCHEFMFNIATRTVTYWLDGVQTFNKSPIDMGGIPTSATFGDGSSVMWHFLFGNRTTGSSYPSSWQYIEFDDFVLADAYIGPTGGGDVTDPAVSITTSDPQSISLDSLSVTGTSSDAVGVSSCKWRLSSAPDGSNGTSCTGTTSWTCSASGFTRGANTLYVGCGDAAGNWGSDSMIVNYLPVIQGVSGLGVSFR